MKPVEPWAQKTECPLDGYKEFQEALNRASFHNAADYGERSEAAKATDQAAYVAISKEWPYWAMERMFREINPLVEWRTFMQKYIDQLVDSR